MLISEEYRKLNSQIHSDDEGWGTTGNRFALIVAELAKEKNAGSILDYGAGKRTMEKALKEMVDCKVRSYDPCIKQISKPPKPADIVSCTDVLEHVEPNCVDSVLDDIKRVTKKSAFLVISTVPAIKILPDGRNAHITVKPAEWWLIKIMERFKLRKMENLGCEFAVVVDVKS